MGMEADLTKTRTKRCWRLLTRRWSRRTRRARTGGTARATGRQAGRATDTPTRWCVHLRPKLPSEVCADTESAASERAGLPRVDDDAAHLRWLHPRAPCSAQRRPLGTLQPRPARERRGVTQLGVFSAHDAGALASASRSGLRAGLRAAGTGRPHVVFALRRALGCALLGVDFAGTIGLPVRVVVVVEVERRTERCTADGPACHAALGTRIPFLYVLSARHTSGIAASRLRLAAAARRTVLLGAAPSAPGPRARPHEREPRVRLAAAVLPRDGGSGECTPAQLVVVARSGGPLPAARRHVSATVGPGGVACRVCAVPVVSDAASFIASSIAASSGLTCARPGRVLDADLEQALIRRSGRRAGKRRRPQQQARRRWRLRQLHSGVSLRAGDADFEEDVPRRRGRQWVPPAPARFLSRLLLRWTAPAYELVHLGRRIPFSPLVDRDEWHGPVPLTLLLALLALVAVCQQRRQHPRDGRERLFVGVLPA